ncbi:hypothetical protein J8I87_39590 [Paraburkholderia sp. LEh10]|uniref:hypothetical protein n=1 Tax=Paraburkholderia sp. LEh10 TaxID=2821353 RepID=UPI001AE90C29|nr:hypothetical protein [Paraburkholderia sp. LEh10]MBP0595642.1 hypothetical protein [Paraburkholderia sp. LEh10]
MEQRQSRQSDGVRIAPDRMTAQEQAFLTEVGRSGVSDAAFRLALIAAPLLSFTTWRTLLIGDLARRAGLSPTEVKQAARELRQLGAFQRRVARLACRRLESFRLCEHFRAPLLDSLQLTDHVDVMSETSGRVTEHGGGG